MVFGLVWFLCLMAYQLFKLFNAKAILLEEQLWYYLTHSWEDKGVHTFPKGICPKVNVIAQLEYELTYYDSTVHRFNHYTTRTPSHGFWFSFSFVKCQLTWVINLQEQGTAKIGIDFVIYESETNFYPLRL